MSLVSDFLTWVQERLDENRRLNSASSGIQEQTTLESLDAYYKALPESVRNFPSIADRYQSQKGILERQAASQDDLLTSFIEESLDAWVKKVDSVGAATPENAKKKLAEISAEVIRVAGASAVIDYSLALAPNGLGAASSTNTKQLLAWLGFGAVLAAVAHDPVKIGVLRPYQDALEQTFRNRRPDDFGLFQAYKTRELSPTKIADLSKLDDAGMDAIENENDKIYFSEISKWGYSEAYAGALSRSATITLNFSQLSALARQGLLTRGLAIYSLWGQGLDRAVMRPALDALMKQNEMASYEGFRSMIEPSYIDGSISEQDLRAYWSRIGVPADVQDWVLPRLRKNREKAALKLASSAQVKEKDLTVSQITQAYQAGLIKFVDAQNSITALGYDIAETKIILDLADTRKKVSGSAALKRLTLTDYEKAYKNKLITIDVVLDRMKGEYQERDIELERKLLEIGKA